MCWQVVKKAVGSACRGSLPGLLAMVVQVLALMWMRTLVNYQVKPSTQINPIVHATAHHTYGRTCRVVSPLTYLHRHLQYSKGGSFGEAFTTLYNEGGIARFYAGFWPAVIVGPISRFGASQTPLSPFPFPFPVLF